MIYVLDAYMFELDKSSSNCGSSEGRPLSLWNMGTGVSGGLTTMSRLSRRLRRFEGGAPTIASNWLKKTKDRRENRAMTRRQMQSAEQR